MITAETLQGHPCRVLVVEDEALIAMLVEDMIHDSGGEMVGPAAKLSDAVDLARNAQADVALLDLNLGGALAYPVALPPISFPGCPERWWGDEALKAETDAPQATLEQ